MTLIGAKPLCTRFDKVDGCIRVSDGKRYLVLLGCKIYYLIYNRIRYLLRVKICITYVFCHNHAKIKFDSCDYLPLEKTLTFHKIDLSEHTLRKFEIKIKITTTIIYL